MKRILIPIGVIGALWAAVFLADMPKAQSAPPGKPIYVTNYVFQTNYVYTFFNQTNWMFAVQTNYVYQTNVLQVTNWFDLNTTNYVHTTVTLSQTNYVNYTNVLNVTNSQVISNCYAVPITNYVFSVRTQVVETVVQPGAWLTNVNVMDGINVWGPAGSVQTLNGTNVTGHLP